MFETYKQLCRRTAKLSQTALPLASPAPGLQWGAWLGLRQEQRTPHKSRREKRKPTKAEAWIHDGHGCKIPGVQTDSRGFIQHHASVICTSMLSVGYVGAAVCECSGTESCAYPDLSVCTYHSIQMSSLFSSTFNY